MADPPKNKQSTVVSSSFIAAKADVDALYNSVVGIVSSLRSTDPITPGIIPERSDDNIGSVFGESTLNSLYRAIGLPAVRNDDQLGSKYTVAEKSQDGSLNYFTLAAAGIDSSKLKSLEDREIKLAQIRPLDIPPSPTPDNVLKGTRVMRDTVLPNSGAAAQPKWRQSLFPMLVCGDVTVYPRERNLAPLFYDKNTFVGDIRQQRPFLEYIILSKLSPLDDGAASGELIASVIKSITPAVTVFNKKELNAINIDKITKELNSSEDQSLMSLRLIQKLYSCLTDCSEDYFRSREQVLQTLDQASYVPIFNGRSPSVAQGYFDITYDKQIELLNSAGIEGERLAVAVKQKSPTLDTEIAKIEVEIAKLSVFFTMTSSSSTSTSDSVSRLVDLTSSNEMIADTFEDIIVQICTVDRRELQQRLNSKKQELDRQRSELERLRQKMDVFTGETLGFSIFDFLAIMIALYESPVSDLVGLLNQDARARLNKIQKLHTLDLDPTNPFADINAFAFGVVPVPDVKDALSRLENKVEEVLNIATAIFNLAGKTDKK
jgi:hypothetical protein